jgi:hypothetical protein
MRALTAIVLFAACMISTKRQPHVFAGKLFQHRAAVVFRSDEPERDDVRRVAFVTPTSRQTITRNIDQFGRCQFAAYDDEDCVASWPRSRTAVQTNAGETALVLDRDSFPMWRAYQRRGQARRELIGDYQAWRCTDCRPIAIDPRGQYLVLRDAHDECWLYYVDSKQTVDIKHCDNAQFLDRNMLFVSDRQDRVIDARAGTTIAFGQPTWLGRDIGLVVRNGAVELIVNGRSAGIVGEALARFRFVTPSQAVLVRGATATTIFADARTRFTQLPVVPTAVLDVHGDEALLDISNDNTLEIAIVDLADGRLIQRRRLEPEDGVVCSAWNDPPRCL